MKTDTKTFLATILGIPLILGGAWGVHAIDEQSTVVVDNETRPVIHIAPEPKEEIPEVKTPAPKKKEPVVVASVPAPATKPAPTPVAVVVQKPATTTQTPKPVVKKVRRTRAS